jgi:predicted transcriptional regulator
MRGLGELGELEAVVMDRLWSAGRPLTVREIFEELKTERLHHRAHCSRQPAPQGLA